MSIRAPKVNAGASVLAGNPCQCTLSGQVQHRAPQPIVEGRRNATIGPSLAGFDGYDSGVVPGQRIGFTGDDKAGLIVKPEMAGNRGRDIDGDGIARRLSVGDWGDQNLDGSRCRSVDGGDDDTRTVLGTFKTAMTLPYTLYKIDYSAPGGKKVAQQR